jgi:DNA-binding NarL/FixJ family response regulator
MKPLVVLVEDEADARESLARSLARAGYRCCAVATAQAALAVTEFVDIVVTDIVLDGDEQAGLDLISALRERGVAAPIVLITAFADVHKLKLGLNRGAAYLLEKPFRAQELLQVLSALRVRVPDIGHHVEQVLLRAGLTDKELLVARHLLKGLSSVEIAALENNSDKTIRQHVTRIYQKVGVTSRSEFFHFVLPL